MTERERYDALVRELIGPDMQAEGFKRLSNRFSRRLPGAWQIVDFQASQFGSRDEVSFTINLAVALDDLRRADATWTERKPPPEYKAHLRQRIGELIFGRDHWWDFDDATDANALAQELIKAIREVGLPWLDARGGLDRTLALIASKPTELGWHDLRALPKLLSDAGRQAAGDAVQAEAARRGSP